MQTRRGAEVTNFHGGEIYYEDGSYTLYEGEPLNYLILSLSLILPERKEQDTKTLIVEGAILRK